LENCFFQKVFINYFILSILFDLVQNASTNLSYSGGENTFSEILESRICETESTRVFEMVSIQILENLFHAKCENGKLFPLLAVLLQKFLTLPHLILQCLLYTVLNVVINSLLEDLIKFRRFIALITEFDNTCVSFHVLSWVLLHDSGVQIVEQNLEVVINFTLTICQREVAVAKHILIHYFLVLIILIF